MISSVEFCFVFFVSLCVYLFVENSIIMHIMWCDYSAEEWHVPVLQISHRIANILEVHTVRFSPHYYIQWLVVSTQSFTSFICAFFLPIRFCLYFFSLLSFVNMSLANFQIFTWRSLPIFFFYSPNEVVLNTHKILVNELSVFFFSHSIVPFLSFVHMHIYEPFIHACSFSVWAWNVNMSLVLIWIDWIQINCHECNAFIRFNSN